MKRIFLLSLLCTMAGSVSASFENRMCMKRPQYSPYQQPAGMSGVTVEVTPQGIYARVDLIFSVGPTTNPPVTDSQEALLFFDLPAGSYVHDSWLWLDNTTIISAELMERRKAAEIYANIVKRRRDPSLLSNALPQSYQLNIFPVTTNYWRKVRICYSTPILWQHGRANVPLPVGLFGAADTPPDFSLTVNGSALFTNPTFAERSFGTWLTAQSGNTWQLTVPGAGYTTLSDLTLSFAYNAGAGARMFTHQTAAADGIYELMVPAPAATPVRYVNLVIDRSTNMYHEPYTMNEIRRTVFSFLSTSMRPADYFNIYYRTSAGVTPLFSNWQHADSQHIHAIAPAFNGTSSTSAPAHVALLKAAMLFSKTSPAGETILVHSNVFYPTTAEINGYITEIRNAVGGFSNRLSVVDIPFGASYHYPMNTMYPYNTMFARLADSTGGAYITNKPGFHDSYPGYYVFDFNLRDALRRSLLAANATTPFFNIGIPITGFTYAAYGPSTGDNYSSGEVYTETGRYYGTIGATGNLSLQYMTPLGMAGTTFPFSAVPVNDTMMRKTWTYHRNTDLSRYGITYKSEVIDSSIRNRVLSDFTAFLALETGDTIKASVGQGGTLLSAGAPQVKSGIITAWPNPFTTNLTIESAAEMRHISVYNAGGSLVMQTDCAPGTQRFSWNGKDGAGGTLPTGIYLIRVSGPTGSTAIRVNKIGS